MADPYTIGISTGAALGATVAIFLSAILQIASVPILPAAFIGAIATLILVIKIASMSRTLDASSLIVFWLMGSLASRTWQHVFVIIPIVVLGGIVVTVYGRELNILSIGKEDAQSLGGQCEESAYDTPSYSFSYNTR